MKFSEPDRTTILLDIQDAELQQVQVDTLLRKAKKRGAWTMMIQCNARHEHSDILDDWYKRSDGTTCIAQKAVGVRVMIR